LIFASAAAGHRSLSDNQVVQDFADLLAAIAAAAADHEITAPEAPVIRQRWEQLKSVTETFVLTCENGTFAPPTNPFTPPPITLPTTAPRPLAHPPPPHRIRSAAHNHTES